MTKQPKKPPFMSVVVIIYNGAKIIPRAIESLLAQDYPKDRYEIIVVNDGSTDNTAGVIAQYKTVRYVELSKNLGIAAGRNAGLKAARGDVYVAFDGDCYAKPNWLTELAAGYSLDKPAGVGGRLVGVGGSRSILMRYIEASDGGIVAKSSGSDKPKSIASRLLAYLGGGLRRNAVDPNARYTEVAELYGANGSFPMEVLRTVGGWREAMAAPAVGGIEDRDLCHRIRQAFPGHHFYTMHQAYMMHDPSITLKKYLLRPYRRGPFNYLFHVSNGMLPPIFPFPILFAIVLLVSVIVWPFACLLELILVPQILYWAWLVRALREKQLVYLLFPYLQLAEETMVLAGLLRGIIVHNKSNHVAR